MGQNLEAVTKRENDRAFKSEGEGQIAHFLEGNSIRYEYEPGVLVNAEGDRPRIWYPDFYLPEFGVYIEYYGMVGEPDYDRGVKVKESVYSRNSMDVIPVYPWMLSKNWKGYIMNKIERSIAERHRAFASKPYQPRARLVADGYTRTTFP